MVNSVNSTLDRTKSWIGEVALGLWIIAETVFYAVFVIVTGVAVLSVLALLPIVPLVLAGGTLLGWGLAVLIAAICVGLLALIIVDINDILAEDD